ncbi:PREDICTED: ryanodine receptor 3-like, partial [Pterocles gutturalis]|uniref:ryanodine receptor 3-like n=1 Tax=Pterocles gutturalis TaxID=240206 RepID=UPI000528FF4A
MAARLAALTWRLCRPACCGGGGSVQMGMESHRNAANKMETEEEREGAPVRKDDEVVLQCVASIHKEQRKFCLAAEGLGNRLCFLEPTSEAKYVPPDLCICNFVLEQSLSVRALQEMLASTGDNASEGAAQGGGHRTLLYGHAILLRHSFSEM